MKREPRTVSRKSVRRLVVTKQRLSGKLPARPADRSILDVVRDLTHVQWDPVPIVAPSHLISLWARLGDYRPRDLERLLWEEKRLFLHWTPIASIVLTEDYPLYRSLMRRYPESLSHSWGRQGIEARRFLTEHSKLRANLLRELAAGPLTLGEFKDHAPTRREEGDWGPSSDVALMLYHLLMSGDVMVVGHRGNQNVWGRSEQFLPTWAPQTEMSPAEFECEAARRAIGALGVATPREITYYFPRGRYEDLAAALARLEGGSVIRRVRIEGEGAREERYLLEADIPLLESMETTAWKPRMSLLPPFDGMVGNADRTTRLFDFRYIREQFLPKEKRKFGTYVLPILWGDRFVGRIDPRLDRDRGELIVNAVHSEPGVGADRELGVRVGETIARFATFLGASRVTYTSRVPKAWRASLR